MAEVQAMEVDLTADERGEISSTKCSAQESDDIKTTKTGYELPW